MKKLTIIQLERQISQYLNPKKVRTPQDLGDAFKLAKSLQENYRKNSEEFITIEKFKNKLLKMIRSTYKKKPELRELPDEDEEERDIYE